MATLKKSYDPQNVCNYHVEPLIFGLFAVL
jgi:hypothetical protein